MKKNLNLFLRILIFINIVSLVLIIKNYYNINEIPWSKIYFVIAGVILGVYILELGYKKFKVIFICIIGIGITAVFSIYGLEIMNYIFTRIEDFHYIVGEIGLKKSVYFGFYKECMTLLIVIVAVVMTVLGTREKRNFLLGLNIILLFVFWFSGEYEYLKRVISLWCFLSVAMFMTHRLRNNGYENNSGENVKSAAWVLRVSLVILGFTVIMPKGFYGHKIFGINEVLDNEYAPGKAIPVEYGDVYRYGDSTERKKKRLGGKVTQQDKVLFNVSGKKIKYFKSATRSSYDGEYWSNYAVEYEKFTKRNLNPWKFTNYNKEIVDEVEVEYTQDLRTKSIFVPSYSGKIKIEDELYYSKGILSVLKEEVDTRKYAVEIYDFVHKETGEALPEIFSQIDEGNSELFNYQLPIRDSENRDKKWGEFNDSEFKGITKRKLEEYNDYLEISETVTEKTIDYTNSLYEKDANTYEKLAAIRAELKKFPYTLEVNEVPEGVDFVDNFLFNEKKGYCTYYASSMAIMARVAGIPSRYCEGFKLNDDNYQVELSTGKPKYRITGMEAHAWVEVLMDVEDDIWIVIEATSGEEFHEESDENTGVPLGDDEENILDPADKEQEEQEEIQQEEQENQEKDDKGNFESGRKIGRINQGSIIPLLIIILVIFKFWMDYRRRENIKYSNNPKKMYEYVLKRLKWARIIKNSSETEMEFTRRISDDKIREVLFNIIECGIKEAYKQEYKYWSENDYYIINEFLESEIGKLKYRIIRLITGQ